MIVDQKYWDDSYKTYEFKRLPINDPTRKIINDFIPRANWDKNAFEIGCYPGRFLVEIGEKGYILNGCDKTELVVPHLANWLQINKCKVGEFIQGDYKNFVNRKYDLVASFGFIEHFTDYVTVFLEHCSMVKSGGYLIIQYPNFRGFIQKSLHIIFDQDNLNNHVIDSMDLNLYIKLIPKDFNIILACYYGNFDFWIDDYKGRNGRFKKKILSFFMKTRKYWSYFPNCEIYSPYAIIIAKKS